MRKTVCILTLICTFISCSKNEVDKFVEIKIDPEKRMNYTTLTQIVDTVIFTPLQQPSQESLFGYIDKILMTDDHIAILDERNNILNLYDLGGNFINRIGKIGNGPGEYISIGDFQIYNGNINILDPIKKQVFVYDLNNNFIDKKDLPFQGDIFSVLEDDLWLWGLSSYNIMKYKGSQIISTNGDFKRINNCINYRDDIDNNTELSYYFSEFNGKTTYHRGLENLVYVFEKNGEIEEYLRFDFTKKYNVAEKYLSNISEFDNSFDNHCYLSTTPLIDDCYILGTLNINDELHSFIYDRKSELTAINSLKHFNPLYLNFPFSAKDKTVISYFNSDIFPGFSEADFLDTATKEIVADGGYVIVKYTLN